MIELSQDIINKMKSDSHIPVDMRPIARAKPMYYDPKVTSTTLADFRKMHCEYFSNEVRYINNTPSDIYVMDRDGLVVCIRRTLNSYRKSFYIQKKLHSSRNVDMDIISIRPSNEGYTKFLNDIPVNQEQIKQGRFNFKNECEKTIEFEDIQKAPHGLYLPSENVVLFTSEATDVIHPSINETSMEGFISTGMDVKSNFFYTVEIVDPANTYGEKFINVNGVIFKVLNHQSSNRKSGVYVGYHNRQDVNGSKNNSEVIYYSFEEADSKLNLFSSYLDALNLGNIDKIREKELKELEFKNKEIKLENELLRNKEERLARELAEEREMLTHERKLKEHYLADEKDRMAHQRKLEEQEIELEAYRRKDYYENRTYERKDSSETIKYIPAIITGVIAVALAVMKLFF